MKGCVIDEAMSIKPILFSTSMVRATLDDRKTVTRRVVTPHYRDGEAGFRVITNAHTGKYVRIEYFDEWEDETRWMHDPYRPGDILYVREAWNKDVGRYMYRADYSDMEKFYRDGKEVSVRWRPSIHMPREAARLFLRVTSVRVERLREITIQGMQMEGVTRQGRPGGCSCAWETETCMSEPCPNRDAYEYACWVLPFIEVWDSTIRPGLRALYGWGGNPWVWVIEYERCEKPEAVP